METGEHGGMVFQDSDLAKWIEAVAYSLIWNPDAALEKTADEAIDIVAQAQLPDGYLDTYYILTGIETVGQIPKTTMKCIVPGICWRPPWRIIRQPESASFWT